MPGGCTMVGGVSSRLCVGLPHRLLAPLRLAVRPLVHPRALRGPPVQHQPQCCPGCLLSHGRRSLRLAEPWAAPQLSDAASRYWHDCTQPHPAALFMSELGEWPQAGGPTSFCRRSFAVMEVQQASWQPKPVQHSLTAEQALAFMHAAHMLPRWT